MGNKDLIAFAYNKTIYINQNSNKADPSTTRGLWSQKLQKHQWKQLILCQYMNAMKSRIGIL